MARFGSQQACQSCPAPQNVGQACPLAQHAVGDLITKHSLLIGGRPSPPYLVCQRLQNQQAVGGGT